MSLNSAGLLPCLQLGLLICVPGPGELWLFWLLYLLHCYIWRSKPCCALWLVRSHSQSFSCGEGLGLYVRTSPALTLHIIISEAGAGSPKEAAGPNMVWTSVRSHTELRPFTCVCERIFLTLRGQEKLDNYNVFFCSALQEGTPFLPRQVTLTQVTLLWSATVLWVSNHACPLPVVTLWL